MRINRMEKNVFNPVLAVSEKLGNYPAEKKMHLMSVIVPNILMDFHKVLLEAPVGVVTSEEYKLDDGSMSIILEGINEGKGPTGCRIVKADVKRNG